MTSLYSIIIIIKLHYKNKLLIRKAFVDKCIKYNNLINNMKIQIIFLSSLKPSIIYERSIKICRKYSINEIKEN